jgi:hypothetical protein
MKKNVALLAFLVLGILAVGLPSCGGGGGGNPGGPNPTPSTTLGTTTTTTQPPAAGDPTIVVSYSKVVGKQPVDVSFSACNSRDGSGGTSLRYLADFADGNGLNPVSGCGFSHRFGSNGVTVYATNVCVENLSGGGNRKCRTQSIKSYVDVSISVAKTGCQKTVVASANLQLGHDSADVVAMTQVDRVQFEAFNGAGTKIGTQEGSKASNTEWRSGTWNVNDDTKLRVKATVFSNGVAGNDTPEGDRPACGS